MEPKEAFALLNSCLNAVATVLLVSAYVAVRRRQYRRHGTLIAATLAVSSVFLACYLYSNFTYGSRTVASMGIESPLVKYAWLAFLAVHVVVAIVMLPFIAAAVWQAYRRRWDRHTRYSRPAFWMWLYVSVTGVMIYFILYHLLPLYGTSA